MTFQVLTFDCYGTLIDWERGILDVLRPWAATHGIAVPDEALLEAFGTTEARCEAETPHAPYPDILAEVFLRMAARWSVPADRHEALDFGRSVRRWPPFPDSADALHTLQRHYKLVILSNVDRESFAYSQAKLGVTFDLVVTAQDVGSYKPDLRNFRFALTRVHETFGAGRNDVLHVAQSLFHDIVPAKSLGLRTVWVNRRNAVGGFGATPAPEVPDAARPDYEVASLQELAARHETIAGGSGP